MNTEKIKAAAIHFALSFFLISILVGLMIYFWFPTSIIKVSNFKEIALLIISIDLILGPLLTFIIYKKNKKGLKFDLLAIASLQLGALVFGVYNLYKVHPVYITFNVDRFTLITAEDAKPEEVTVKSLINSKISSPKLVISKLPDDINKLNDLILDTLETGVSDFEFKSEYYRPYDSGSLQDVISKSLDPNTLFKKKESKQKLDKFINKYGKKINDYAYLPLEGTSKDAIWVLDIRTGKPIDSIAVIPWDLAKYNNK